MGNPAAASTPARSALLTIMVMLASLAAPSVALAASRVLSPSGRARATLLPARPAAKGLAPAPRTIPRLVPDPSRLAEKKAAAALRYRRAEGARLAPSPGAPAPEAAVGGGTVVVDGLNAPGLSALDNGPGNQGSPSDATGAIGLDHYVEIVNRKVAVYDRADLGLVGSLNLDTFVGAPGALVFDPQVQWDPQANRWFYLAADIEGEGNNFLVFGWSKTSDPSDLTGGWCRFGLSTGDILDDYPKLGHNDNHIIFGTNAVYAEAFFLTARIWTVAKPANGQTSCPASLPTFYFGTPFFDPLTTADGDTAFTPVPANTAGSSANGYVVAADYPQFVSGPNQVMAWHVSGPGGSPTLTVDGNMSVSSFGVPADVPQPGTSNLLDSLDTRLTQAVARADPLVSGQQAVWTQHTIDGPGGRSVVRWYELLPGSLTVRQQGTIADASGFVFNGAISPAFNGSTAAIHFNTGSSTRLADIRAQSRLGSTPLGQMTGDALLGTSSAMDQDFTCTPPNGPPCRWGDYAGASPDPVNEQAVWGSNQLSGPATSDPAWLTRNFALTDGAAGYVRPKGASPLRVSLVPAYAECTAPNRVHGPPLTYGSCNPPSEASGYLTVGTPDANGFAANAGALLRLDAVPGDPSTPADEADVQLAASSSDVRVKPGLGDYTGELQARVALRITDRASGAGGDEPATLQDLTFEFAVPCQSTVDPSIGGSCSISTTADALTPGTVTEAKRTIWQLAQVQLFDGGPDQIASTEPNALFETQGVFVP